MGFIRHGGDFAYPIGDADRVNGLHRAQAGEASDRRSRRHSRCGGRAGRSRQAARTGDPDRRRAPPRGVRESTLRLRECGSPGRQRRKASGDPRPTTTGRAVANPSAGERSQKRERVRLVAQRVKGRDNPRAPEAREAQTLLGEATAESGASGRLDCPSPGEGVAAQGRLRIGVGRGQGRSPIRKRPSKHKARSRDGRWTVIPGAYVSRWEPYAEAHEPRQGQPP